ncbi:hypothetical protein SBA5_1150001 [Candidatus Sulfotelmatomonas gaucii]|uniref:Uncharacterized protein n=1 Tax=Candidatus Sulfuritelmatomonas gaucii TaxID=2043161 RepID=A0A2N9L4J1_9BACT|nr:hypothetical protein SBA5_1150001 [Candidatus Sulfotelmatomonas gaucii]
MSLTVEPSALGRAFGDAPNVPLKLRGFVRINAAGAGSFLLLGAPVQNDVQRRGVLRFIADNQEFALIFDVFCARLAVG